MTSPLSNKQRVESARHINSRDTDDDGPLELVRPGKDHGRDVREHLKQVLEGCLDGGECTPVFRFDFLLPVLVILTLAEGKETLTS